jgi:hypothetical protein
MLAHSGGGFPHASSFGKPEEQKTMDTRKDHISRKGGRPRKAIKKDQLLGMKCTLIERRAIEAKARSANLSVSEYLRELGLTGKIDSTKKALPKEILQLIGTLNHLAANMNQVAKKRNSNEILNALERATLQHESAAIKQLAKDIKTYLQ